MFKHQFFSAYPYYVRFETSEETIASMGKYLEVEADRLRSEGIVLAPALLPPTRIERIRFAAIRAELPAHVASWQASAGSRVAGYAENAQCCR